MLHIKEEGPEIEEFIKNHSSKAVVFRWDAMEQRKRGNRERKKYMKQCKKTKRRGFTNELIYLFLKSSSDEDEGNVN